LLDIFTIYTRQCFSHYCFIFQFYTYSFSLYFHAISDYFLPFSTCFVYFRYAYFVTYYDIFHMAVISSFSFSLIFTWYFIMILFSLSFANMPFWLFLIIFFRAILLPHDAAYQDIIDYFRHDAIIFSLLSLCFLITSLLIILFSLILTHLSFIFISFITLSHWDYYIDIFMITLRRYHFAFHYAFISFSLAICWLASTLDAFAWRHAVWFFFLSAAFMPFSTPPYILLLTFRQLLSLRCVSPRRAYAAAMLFMLFAGISHSLSEPRHYRKWLLVHCRLLSPCHFWWYMPRLIIIFIAFAPCCWLLLARCLRLRHYFFFFRHAAMPLFYAIDAAVVYVYFISPLSDYARVV